MNRYSTPVALAVGISVVGLLGSGVSAKEESSGAAPSQAPVISTPAVPAPVQAPGAVKSD